jgi:2-polyprenyl-3-methyl-5-hydroxy-6-metoxy-1,4-benzoquinol methylase
VSTVARATPPDPSRLSSASARYESNSVMREYRYDRTRILLEWIGEGKRVLEVGCSTGYISRLLVERKCDVTGVEIDPAAAEKARSYCREALVLDLNSPLWVESLGGRTFDVVLLADVLEHLVDPWRVLREIAGLLDAAGSVVISLPNLVHFVTRAKIALGQFNYTSTGTLDHTHLRFFTVETARELIQSSGYRIARFHPAVGGGRLSDRVRFALQFSARFAPGLFAYQMLFEAKSASERNR